MVSNLKRLAAVISPRWRTASQCAACGEDFACGATLRGCWCSEISLSNEQREKLQERYSGCLCRTCLENAASLVTPFYKIEKNPPIDDQEGDSARK